MDVPHGVDLVVLDTAPLWLSGRIAQQGRLLFDDGTPARVRWQAETRLPYLDEIPAIEDCARFAHHLIASEGWRVAESNADAVRTLGVQRVVPAPTAEAVARAVGFRNVLVHEYADVDDGQVRGNLQHFADLEAFVSQVAAWSGD